MAASRPDPAEAKRAAAALFMEVFDADARLKSADANLVRSLVNAAVTFGMDGKLAFQGVQLFDTLAGRGVPSSPLVQALLAYESRAAKLGVAVRQPRAVTLLSVRERAELLRTAPGAVDVREAAQQKAAERSAVRDPKRAAQRWRMVGVAIACAGVVMGLASLGVAPAKPRSVRVSMSAEAMPCTSFTSTRSFVFCIVDAGRLGAETDDQIRARIKASQQAARSSGFTEMAFLLPGVGPEGERLRYKPQLWQRDPPKNKAILPARLVVEAPPSTK